MIEIRYVKSEDKEFWYGLDKHLPEREFINKVSNKRGYILLDDNKPIGDIIFSGTIRRFVQCYLLIAIIKEKVMGRNLWNIGKMI